MATRKLPKSKEVAAATNCRCPAEINTAASRVAKSSIAHRSDRRLNRGRVIGHAIAFRAESGHVHARPRPTDRFVSQYPERRGSQNSWIEAGRRQCPGDRRVPCDCQISAEGQSKRGDVVPGAGRRNVGGKNHVGIGDGRRNLRPADLHLGTVQLAHKNDSSQCHRPGTD
jgi:hypothetical protein